MVLLIPNLNLQTFNHKPSALSTEVPANGAKTKEIDPHGTSDPRIKHNVLVTGATLY